MARYRLLLKYAGTRYRGWQVQKNARTVQGTLRQAIEQVTGDRELELYGSGRTDAGVHALLQVAHLEVAREPGGPKVGVGRPRRRGLTGQPPLLHLPSLQPLAPELEELNERAIRRHRIERE